MIADRSEIEITGRSGSAILVSEDEFRSLQETAQLERTFTDHGWDDYQHWIAEDLQVLRGVNSLLTDARRDPARGIGKPERLRYQDRSLRLRRITQEHRLVYSFDSERLTVWQCRFHYR